jgi:hypothetical protein
MTSIFFDSPMQDQLRRSRLFEGNLFLYGATDATKELVQFARETIHESFSGLDPQRAQSSMEVEDYVAIIAPLKTKFTNHERTKALVQKSLVDFGCDMEKTYFDVPRLRVVTDGGYLSSGVGYAYKAHRDTWYSGPNCQINWWMPVYDLEPERAMALYPAYFQQPIQNSSNEFDYDDWVTTGRKSAIEHVKTDSRKHPLPREQIDEANETRIVCGAAATLLFSGAQLHATVPNTSGLTRFSLDFRTVHLDDLLNGRGARNVDSSATGTTVRDFIRASDLSPIPAHSFSAS